MTSHSRLRIVAGAARGRRLVAPPGRSVRPTPDRVREALFSILGERCRGAQVLDAFAGTGALGLEALSRGAEGALLVERSGSVARLLADNAKRCGFEQEAEVLVGDVIRLVPRFAEQGRGPFDLVFVDPPFKSDLSGTLLDVLSETGSLAPEALVVVEHPAGTEPGGGVLERRDLRRYGTVALSFFQGEQDRVREKNAER